MYLFFVAFIVCQLTSDSLLSLHRPPGHPSTGGRPRYRSPLWGQGHPLYLLWSSGLGYAVLLNLWAPHRGLSRNTRRQWAGNCCLRHPFSPVLEPRQGGDICSLAGLTWPHVIIPATMSSLQYRHGAPPRHGAMCRGPPSGGFYPVGGFLSEPCQYIPCPLLPTTWSCVFIARHNINCYFSIK